jgi:hypothetical protein
MKNTNNKTAADFAKSILAVHNRERAAVGVPPLVWSDKLAADAKPWAEHLATTAEFGHPTAEWVAAHPTGPEGENLAGFFRDVSEPNGGQSLWVDEKKDYHAGTPCCKPGEPITGHYTQMVWNTTKAVGCATASGNGHPFSILICRYSPPGNILGLPPY